MEASEFLQTVEALHEDARRRGLYFQQTTGAQLQGRRITVQGRELLSFGSCSYLGLEFHPRLVEGVKDAVTRYGTQFSSSRGYLSAPPYEELERTLEQIFGGHVLVAASTTLGHLSAFEVLANERDAVLMDHQVHQSVQQAVNLTRARGTRVAIVRHEEMDRAPEMIKELAQSHRTVWFTTDGIASMYGDLAPYGLLQQILDVAPNVRLYIDDAHGMTWMGRHGCGSFLANMALSERIVLATSLNKAFAGSGGALVFASAKERDRVRMCGGTMTFSGPMQPPMLGACLASARLHLTPELDALQEQLRSRVRHTNALIKKAGLPLLVENDVPIFFLRLGLPRVANEVAQRLAEEGLYVNVSMYPTVPMRRAGIRLSVNALHSPEDLERVVDALARHIPVVLEEEGMTREQLETLFARTVVSHLGAGTRVRAPEARSPDLTPSPPITPVPYPISVATPARPTRPSAGGRLAVQEFSTIRDVPQDEWNAMLGGVGACSWDSLRMLERLYSNQPLPEHNWKFHYAIVRDAHGNPVAATQFSVSLQKDDFIMRPEVSEAAEQRRADDPYFLTSRVVMTGSAFSEGNHVFVDRHGPWREGLVELLKVASRLYDEERADMILVRDLPGEDPEMDAFMLSQGLVKAPMLDTHVRDVTWQSAEELFSSLPHGKRLQLRSTIATMGEFERRIYGAGIPGSEPMDSKLITHLHQLYLNVARRKLRINVFPMPENTISALLESPSWEIMTLTPRDPATGRADGLPVTWGALHKHQGHYAAFCCGVDYNFVTRERSAYRQNMLNVLLRARELKAHTVHLGMDADTEKRRFGTRVLKNCVYAQVGDHFQGAVMRDLVAQLGMAQETTPRVARTVDA